MQKVNRIFYQNEPYNFLSTEIKTFFPFRGILHRAIPNLAEGIEVWVQFQIPHPKKIMGYKRAIVTKVDIHNIAYTVRYTCKHYEDGGVHVFPERDPEKIEYRIFRLTEDDEGRLNYLLELHPLAKSPMI